LADLCKTSAVTEEDAQALFGEDGWREMEEAQIEALIASLRAFFERIEPTTQQNDEH